MLAREITGNAANGTRLAYNLPTCQLANSNPGTT